MSGLSVFDNPAVGNATLRAAPDHQVRIRQLAHVDVATGKVGASVVLDAGGAPVAVAATASDVWVAPFDAAEVQRVRLP